MRSAYAETKVREWLAQKQLSPACPTCGKDDWQVHDLVLPTPIEGTAWSGGVKAKAQGGVVFVPVICNYCSAVRWFVAAPLGLPYDAVQAAISAEAKNGGSDAQGTDTTANP
jgi:hypothetical protein